MLLSNQGKNFLPKSFKSPITVRAFGSAWWIWLNWDLASERVFCHAYVLAYRQKKLRSSKADTAFICKGYQYWKDATVASRHHEASQWRIQDFQWEG